MESGKVSIKPEPVKLAARAIAALGSSHRLILLRRNAPTRPTCDAFVCLNASQAETISGRIPFWGEIPFGVSRATLRQRKRDGRRLKQCSTSRSVISSGAGIAAAHRLGIQSGPNRKAGQILEPLTP